jgi:PAS domain S-box-containing protein
MADALQSITVGLVDDDEVDRMHVRRALRAAGVQGELLEASDAVRGLELLESKRLDCAFLDFNMPGRDGLWLVREARARGIRTPLIVLTGHGDERIAVELMKAGAADYFAKANATSERVASGLRQALRVAHAENALRESEQRLRLALEATQLGTWDFDPGTGRLEWCPRCKALFGLPPDAAINYDVFLAGLHPEDRARTDAAVKSALEPGGRAAYDIEYRTVGLRDGVERWLRATGRAFFDEAGRATRFVGTVQDIGESKQLEAERAKLLTAESRARERAEAASRMREDLVAVVSHDLRNPLSAITMSAGLLAKTLEVDPGSRAAKQVETITRSAERMRRLISDLLDMASIDSGGLSVHPEQQDVSALLQEAAEMMQAIAADKSICFNVLEPQPSLALLADRERVLQVLSNLIGNAIKFSREGGAIELGAAAHDGRVRLWVTDTGQGISEEHLPHVFDRFWQARKDGRRGIGLGLSIAKGIVEAHGGEIWAESVLGSGTTFHFTLRAARG